MPEMTASDMWTAIYRISGLDSTPSPAELLEPYYALGLGLLLGFVVVFFFLVTQALNSPKDKP